MAYHPPPHLIELLERTGLAAAAQVHAQARRVGRLARGLPGFDSLWLDALVQSRCLTPFQAREIAAGRAEQLRVGQFVCCRPLVWPQYVRAFQARRVADQRAALLVVIECPDHQADALLGGLRGLADCVPKLRSEHLAPIVEVGRDGARVWAAAEWHEGVCAIRPLTHHGRFEPEAVLEIVRQMAAGLAELEQVGLCHGDLSPAGLLLDRNGRVVLPLPGLRPIVRPEEGYGRADLPPAAFDYLAPERIEHGTPPDVLSDIYACGCVWWHLLTGRPPLSGGDSLGKLRSAQQGAIPDVRRLAPATPEALAGVVTACLAREPADRPGSMAELATMLGSPSARGAVAVARQTAPRRSGLAVRWHKGVGQVRRNGTGPFWLSVAAGCLVAAGAALWATWNRPSPGTAQIPAQTAMAQNHAPSPSESAETPRADRNKLPPVQPPDHPGQAQAGTRTALRPNTAAGNPRSAGPLASGFEGTSSQVSGAPGSSVVPAEYRQGVDHTRGLGRRPSGVPVSGGSRSVQGEPSGGEIVIRVQNGQNGPLRLDSLDLKPNQRIRGEGPGRVVVVVPPGGLVVDVEGVVFENLAFCCQALEPTGPVLPLEGQDTGALVELRCGRAEFRNCTFSVPGAGAPQRPAALAWQWPTPRGTALGGERSSGLPTGRLRLENCVFSRVRAAVECRPGAALAVELRNVLHVAPGPLLRLSGGTEADQPLVIRARRLTLRDSGPLVEMDLAHSDADGPTGSLRIEASASVFAPRAPVPLILFLRPRSFEPESVARTFWWDGQGSLVAEGIPVAAWGAREDGAEPLDEGTLAIAGLVRSRVEFAGPALDDPAHSRVTGWQAPLTGPQAPGFDPSILAGKAQGGP